jgi:hypothetical protein
VAAGEDVLLLCHCRRQADAPCMANRCHGDGVAAVLQRRATAMRDGTALAAAWAQRALSDLGAVVERERAQGRQAAREAWEAAATRGDETAMAVAAAAGRRRRAAREVQVAALRAGRKAEARARRLAAAQALAEEARLRNATLHLQRVRLRQALRALVGQERDDRQERVDGLLLEQARTRARAERRREQEVAAAVEAYRQAQRERLRAELARVHGLRRVLQAQVEAAAEAAAAAAVALPPPPPPRPPSPPRSSESAARAVEVRRIGRIDFGDRDPANEEEGIATLRRLQSGVRRWRDRAFETAMLGVLGLRPSAALTRRDVTVAYRSKSKLVHPDKRGEATLEDTSAAWARLVAAYEWARQWAQP